MFCDQDGGLRWTQVDRSGLVFGHNLDTVWSFLWVRGLPFVLLATLLFGHFGKLLYCVLGKELWFFRGTF